MLALFTLRRQPRRALGDATAKNKDRNHLAPLTWRRRLSPRCLRPTRKWKYHSDSQNRLSKCSVSPVELVFISPEDFGSHGLHGRTYIDVDFEGNAVARRYEARRGSGVPCQRFDAAVRLPLVTTGHCFKSFTSPRAAQHEVANGGAPLINDDNGHKVSEEVQRGVIGFL